MDIEFSTLRVEAERIRVRRGTNQRLMVEPVVVVDQVAVEGGMEFILRSPTNALRAVVAAADTESLAVADGLPHVVLDPAEIAALRNRIEVASLPMNPTFDRFSDAQKRDQARLESYRRHMRTKALTMAVFAALAAVILALAR